MLGFRLMCTARRVGSGLVLPLISLVLSSCGLELSGLDQGCATDSQCPSGSVCVDGRCAVSTDAGRDAGQLPDADIDASLDAGDGGSDAGPDGCSNGVLDPGETEIDCGGACPRCFGPTGVEGMVLWLRADDLSAGSVTSWPDRSGNGNGFANGTVAPTQVAGAVNGEPSVSFSVDAQLASVAPVSLGGTLQLSLVYVARTRTSVGILLEGSEDFRMNPGGFLDLRNSAGTGEFDVQHGSNGMIASWKTDQLDSEWHWLASVHDVALTTGEAVAYVDGTSSGRAGQNSDTTVAFANHRWFLGGRSGTSVFGFDGEIAEVIAYSRALDATDLAHLDAYMASRYGL